MEDPEKLSGGMYDVLRRNATGDGAICVFADPARTAEAIALRIVVAIEGVVAVTIVLVNAYSMAAIWPRRRRRSTQSTLFVLQLALADALCGLSKIVNVAYSTHCGLAELAATCEIACLLPVVLNTFTWTLSATTLAAIAVDRYVCIVHSLRYYEFMNTRRVLVILGCLWVFSMVCALLYLPTWEWQEGRFCEEQNIVPLWHLLAVQIPMSTLVLFVVAATHISIRSEAKRNAARCKAPWLHSPSASVRSAKITILVVSSFVMGYLPMQVFQVLMVQFVVDADSRLHWDFFIVEIFSSLWYLLNPFIYAWKNASIREDMTVLWRRIAAKMPAPLGALLLVGGGGEEKGFGIAKAPPAPPPGARRF